MSMNPEIKAKWVAALRSGEYKQAKEELRAGSAMCCLGVLCDLIDPEGWDSSGGPAHRKSLGVPGPEVLAEAELPDPKGAFVVINGMSDWLTLHNDAGRTFAEIADAIEAQL